MIVANAVNLVCNGVVPSAVRDQASWPADFVNACGWFRLVGIVSLIGNAVESGEQLIAVQVFPSRVLLVEVWETFAQFRKVDGVF